MIKYPSNFLWGASTASHQVEGNTHNQWTAWETANAERLATEASVKLSWLPDVSAIMPQINRPDNYLSGTGVGHYKRYAEDFDILGKLNMNAYRFSIEWSRIEPKPGIWDETAIQHYRDYISLLKSQNIEPVLTLWHWTMPVWFTDLGGFETASNVQYFERYCRRMAQEFANTVNYVLTLNEPNVYASFSYASGEWPPQYKRPLLALRVYRNLAQAHRVAYRAFKQLNPALQIGLAAQLGDIRPRSPGNVINQLVVKAMAYGWNWWFLQRICGQLDYIGLNYYFTDYRDWRGRSTNPAGPLSDLGWYMEPSGIGNLLTDVWQRYRLPIMITENGLADASDSQRQWWLEQTLAAVETALSNGVPLLGYLHWSLLDNFEWAYGWWPKFGLVAVDRTTMKRSIKLSALWLADYIKHARRLE